MQAVVVQIGCGSLCAVELEAHFLQLFRDGEDLFFIFIPHRNEHTALMLRGNCMSLVWWIFNMWCTTEKCMSSRLIPVPPEQCRISARSPMWYILLRPHRYKQWSYSGHPTRKKVSTIPDNLDFCSVHCVWALKEEGYEAIIVNNNPETVSTDFDTSDRLYFDPLTPEDVDSIIETEKPWGAIVQFGGQTAIGLTKHLEESAGQYESGQNRIQ